MLLSERKPESEVVEMSGAATLVAQMHHIQDSASPQAQPQLSALVMPLLPRLPC